MNHGIHRSELLGYFLVEVDEQLVLLEQQILKLEKNGESPDIIQTIFRAAHTLKGSSAAMGFEEMKRLTHEMENILDQIRHKVMTVTGQVINVLFQCLDVLTAMNTQIKNEGISNMSIDAVINQLQQLKPNGHHPHRAEKSFSSASLSEEHRTVLSEAEKQGLHRWICEVVFSDHCEMKGARAFIVHHHLEELGIVITTHPPLETLEQEDIDCITYCVISRHEQSVIEERIHALIDVSQVKVIPVQTENADRPNEKQITEINIPALNSKSLDTPKGDEFRRIGQTIRVDVDRLENLMNLVGELVIDQTRIAQVGTVLRDMVAADADETLDELDQISNHITRIVGELQGSVMKTRMLPIEQLFNRFPRTVRDLTQALHKDIDFIVEGKETELDRTVIEEIGDPLIHLIRNAIDHGIEATEVRRQRGKPLKGTVRIKATQPSRFNH
ncbi:Hpt domain-containing protein [Paenibacillus sp. PvR098]|uniref:Hpt domain-containing protein n=1 Tax=unclassified Paenibacillus TaxID=185978 RepID=UPI001B5F7B5C|nr:chemotaxis protein histidine kinase CheA [Paenibacillus sp. PvP091]MBP1168158.1 chemotaxis protein histidine kinase CheA [Paenibacillus sp. PvR098]MBP2439186.1 chemotaxis protein histidine kinase CheA [Paenibacillus sp. PvP052]